MHQRAHDKLSVLAGAIVIGRYSAVHYSLTLYSQNHEHNSDHQDSGEDCLAVAAKGFAPRTVD